MQYNYHGAGPGRCGPGSADDKKTAGGACAFAAAGGAVIKHKAYILPALCLLLVLFSVLTSVTGESRLIMVAFDYGFDWNPKDETMPFFSGNTLYIYYEHFTRLRSIDSAYYNARLQQVRLFNINDQLTFDLANSQTYDENGNKYEGVALWKGGKIFLPAGTVRDKFDLYFSYLSSAAPAPVAILSSPSIPATSDSEFLRKTEFLRNDTIYVNYLASIEPPEVTPGEPQPPVIPQTPSVSPPEPEPRLTYLTFAGAFSEATEDILDALDGGGAKGTFFIPPQDIRTSADLLRRAYAKGHAIGLLMENAPGLDTALEAANEQLKAVLFTKTRLVCVAEGADLVDEALRDRVVGAGYRLWDGTIVSPGTDAGADVKAVRNGLYRSTATSVIQLPHSPAAAETISEVLRYIRNNHFSLLTMKELDTPINRAGDVR